ncbi:hypothetical protein TruAng_001782 [Truncatella angustata]|nr:hypothetical protein TruAng_001782 [Truncatella angustata]
MGHGSKKTNKVPRKKKVTFGIDDGNPWKGPYLHQEYQQLYYYRLGADGETEFDWIVESEDQQLDSAIPRDESLDVAGSFDNLDINDIPGNDGDAVDWLDSTDDYIELGQTHYGDNKVVSGSYRREKELAHPESWETFQNPGLNVNVAFPLDPKGKGVAGWDDDDDVEGSESQSNMISKTMTYSMAWTKVGKKAATLVAMESPRVLTVILAMRLVLAGWVFKCEWAEPLGDMGPVTEIQSKDPRDGFYIGPRRWIIIATDHGNSSCVPILTYERRACTKPGIRPESHGIAHSSTDYPQLISGEQSLGFEPVSILMTNNEKLSIESRVNYSKLQTIEHNARVKFIGSVASESLRVVQDAVDECWRRKQMTPSQKRHTSKDKRKDKYRKR